MGLLEALAGAVTTFISQTSYLGVAALMALESANIPVPSEVILPFSGFLVSQGVFDFWAVVGAGTIGCTVGSLGSYYLGRWSESTWVRTWLTGWGRILITPDELSRGERWIGRHGDLVVFLSRLLPVVRTFISFPAGLARLNLIKFTVYTFVGSLLWSLVLTEIGFQLGQNWMEIKPLFQKFDLGIVVVLAAGFIWFIRHRRRMMHR